MDKKKKILSLVLALIMIISALPISAMAEEDGQPVTREEESKVSDFEVSEDIIPSALRGLTSGAKGNPGPNWNEDEESQDLGGDYWPLPQGVRIITAQNGADPLNAYGMTYRGNYLTDEGRLAITGTITQKQTITSGVWKHYAMKLPKELFYKIDWEKSYVSYKTLERGSVKFFKFSDPFTSGLGSRYIKTFPWQSAGTNHGSSEWHLILKEKDNEGNVITWDNTFKDRDQVIQLRLFDQNASRIWSASRREGKFTKTSYNAYTKTAMIPGKSKLPEDWMLSSSINLRANGTEYMWTADSMLQLDKENKKLRIVYIKTNTSLGKDFESYDEDLGLRQTFDREFIKYLDLKDKSKPIATVTAYDYNENWKTNRSIEVYPNDINGVALDNEGNIVFEADGTPKYDREDGAAFIQLVQSGFDNKGNNRVISRPKGQGEDFFFAGSSVEGNPLVFEYNIDPEAINNDLVKDGEFLKNFLFDTRYITDNKVGMKEFEITLDKDLVIPGGKDTFLNLKFTPEMSISGALTAPFTPRDIVINIGDQEGIFKSWKRNGSLEYWGDYYIPLYGPDAESANGFAPDVGYKFKRGQKITVMVPSNLNGIDKVTKVDFQVTKDRNKTFGSNNAKPVEGSQFQLNPVEGVSHKPMYLENTVSTIGGTATRIKYVPIADEIFTDGLDINSNVKDSFTGYNKYSDGFVTSEIWAKNKNELKTENTAARFGKYHITSESDDNGNHTFYVADGKDELKEIASELIEDTVTVNGQNYTGFKFAIKKQYNDLNSNVIEEIENLELLKDMPVVFKAEDYTALSSEPVVEQIQARITFDTLKTNTQGYNEEIIKIAPLNNEFLYNPLEIEKSNIKAGSKNNEYKPSGFSGDNLRVDTVKATVVVDGKTYPNFLDHNGKTYDLEKVEEKTAFMMRQWPENPAKDGMKVIGWTTKELKDIEGGKTALEQFGELESKQTGTNQEAGYLRDIKDWEKVDLDQDVFIFDEKSPIDKHRTVYAVWGPSVNIVLHANNTDNPDVETIVKIPIVPEDKERGDRLIDAITSATNANEVLELKQNNTIKEIPKAPHAPTRENQYDPRLQDFVKSDHSFIGWTLERDANLQAGAMNDRIDDLEAGKAKKIVGLEIKEYNVPKKVEWTKNIAPNKTNVYLPNGYNLGIDKSFDDLINSGKDIHLYANYRPYFDVELEPRFKDIGLDPNGKQIYTELADPNKEVSLRLGLLYRTAVTGYDNPTVLNSATYRPIGDRSQLKEYVPNRTEVLKWTLPGYDELGRRHSYVGAIIPVGKEEIYEKFGENQWQELGITTYVRLVSGSVPTLDPNGKKNLHQLNVAGYKFDPYGGQLAKSQTFSHENSDGAVDVYTSATARGAKVKELDFGYNLTEVEGYKIVMTNNPETLPTPIFDPVKDTDKKVQIKWESIEKQAEIETIILTLPTTGSEAIKVELTKDQDGNYSAEGYTVNIDETSGRLSITATEGLSLSGLAGKNITAKFIKKAGEGNIEGPLGKVTIEAEKVSHPVNAMEQIEKDQEGRPRIKFTVPTAVTDKVSRGAKYIAQIFVENVWVDLGNYTVNELNPEGNSYEITLDNPGVTLKHGDIIRIKSEEVGKLPSDSTGTGNENYSPVEEFEVNKKYIKLDLQGPKGDIIGKDETFRRYIEISGALDELPEGQLELIIDTNRNDSIDDEDDKIPFDFTTIGDYLTTYPRKDDMPKMWVRTIDKFGNQEDNEVTYNPTYQFTIRVLEPRQNRNFLRIASSIDGAKVTVSIVNAAREEVFSKEYTNIGKDYNKCILETDSDNFYRLKKGDNIYLEGKVEKDGKTYTTNPMIVEVR